MEHLIRELGATVSEQHQFLRDHARSEESALNTIDKTLGELLAETRTQTQSNIRLADIHEERWRHEKEERERKARLAEIEAKHQAEAKAQAGAWFRAQWDKWSMPAIIILGAAVAPNALPLVARSLGLIVAQPVEVVQAAPPSPAPVADGSTGASKVSD